MSTLAVSPLRPRTILAAVFLLVPAIALGADNGNQGTPQNDCERQATSDYQQNLASCDRNLADNEPQRLQCHVDFSYEYEDALAACKNTAQIGGFGGKLHGRFNPVISGELQTSGGSGPALSAKGLKFGAFAAD
ncbi:MAG TPA: hypothetical protein VHA07_09175 [Devosia sp.]|nr:hypothetical protein [Devosia sp.]